ALVLASAALWAVAWGQSPYNAMPQPVYHALPVPPGAPPAPAPQPVMQPQPQQPAAPPTMIVVPVALPVNQPAPPEVNPSPRDLADVSQTNDNPTGRQEPAVSIEWIGPATAKLGQPVTYQIIVKNISLNNINQVGVRCPVPAGARITASEP